VADSPDSKDTNRRNVSSRSVERSGHGERFPFSREPHTSRLCSGEREPILLAILRGEEILERDRDLSENGILEEVPGVGSKKRKRKEGEVSFASKRNSAKVEMKATRYED